jgi:hypothetical protein
MCNQQRRYRAERNRGSCVMVKIVKKTSSVDRL